MLDEEEKELPTYGMLLYHLNNIDDQLDEAEENLNVVISKVEKKILKHRTNRAL
jgi:hypothetical protein